MINQAIALNHRVKVSIITKDSEYGDYLRRILNGEKLIWLYGYYNSGVQFIKNLNSPFRPDTCLIDSELEDLEGLTCAREIKRRQKRIHIIYMAERVDNASLAEAKGLGIDYIEKGTRIEKTLDKIILSPLEKPEQIISLNYTGDGNLDFLGLATALESIQNKVLTLSENQIKVLQLKKTGKSVNEIAKTLDMNFETVRTHLKRGLRKLNLPNIWDYISV